MNDLIRMSPTQVTWRRKRKHISSSENSKNKTGNTSVTNLSPVKSLSWEESSSSSAKPVSTAKSIQPAEKTKLESIPVETSWSTLQATNSTPTIHHQMKSLNAKSVLKKLKTQKTFCLTHASVQGHAEQYIWNVWLNGFISKSRNKSSGVLNTIISKSSSAKSARLSSPWSLILLVPIRNFYLLRNPKATTWFWRELVIRKKVS